MLYLWGKAADVHWITKVGGVCRASLTNWDEKKRKILCVSGIVPRFFRRSARSLVIIAVFQKKAINARSSLGGALVLGDRVALYDVDLDRQDVAGDTHCKIHPRTGYEGPDGKYSFANLGAGWGWAVNATPRLLYHRERDPVTIVYTPV
jgi:hypothetical protein